METSAPLFILRAQAKRLAKQDNLKLHAAQDAIAEREGFRSWSHMAAQAKADPLTQAYDAMPPGTLGLLAGRPGQGKTIMGLRLAVEALRKGRPAAFHSLDDTEANVSARLTDMGAADVVQTPRFTLDLTETIEAATIAASMAEGALVVVDYLQLLDQRRAAPALNDQVRQLREAARARQASVIVLSQIWRSFDPASRPLPDWEDIRTPNPLDVSLFDVACFLHGGRMRLSKPVLDEAHAL